jgi:hypothetical protein
LRKRFAWLDEISGREAFLLMLVRARVDTIYRLGDIVDSSLPGFGGVSGTARSSILV